MQPTGRLLCLGLSPCQLLTLRHHLIGALLGARAGSGAVGRAGRLEEEASAHEQALQRMLGHSVRPGAAAAAADGEDGGAADDSGGSSSEEEPSSSLASSDTELAGSSSSEDEEEDEGGAGRRRRRRQGQRAGAAAEQGPGVELDSAAAPYSARDPASGTPAPLLPELVTLSLLPRSQWQNLVHLETIRARSRPLAPPKKPEAAPFFLPTVAGADAGRNPVFDLGGGGTVAAAGGQQGPAAGGGEDPLAAAAAAAWGAGEEDVEEEGSGRLEVDFEAGGSGSSSGEEEEEGGAAGRRQRARQRRRQQGGRIVKSGGRGGAGGLARLLRSCAEAGDWTSAVGHLRGLPPAQLDAQIREMQVADTFGNPLRFFPSVGV